MSRSYKKTPIVKSGGYGGHDDKRFARRKWRRSIKEDDVASKRSLYKRNYSTWDINDYINRWTKEEAIDYYNNIKDKAKLNNWERQYYKNILKRYPTLESYLEKYWYKNFRRK